MGNERVAQVRPDPVPPTQVAAVRGAGRL